MDITEIISTFAALLFLGWLCWLSFRQFKPIAEAEKAHIKAATRFFNAAAEEIEGGL